MSDTAIGGYFEFELSPAQGEYYPNAYHFQSGRAAFLSLLLTGRPTLVWMPRYLCESMFEPLYQSDTPFKLYTIDEQLGIADTIYLKANEWLLYVNYFGVCDHQVARVLSSFPPESIIIDHSQAFFSTPPACLATLYSARKFFGVPDGGYLITDLPVKQPEEEDNYSLERCKHLLKRLAVGPEYGYVDYRAAEASLTKLAPLRMSKLTCSLLGSINYDFAKTRRSRNFIKLHAWLGQHNRLYFPIDNNQAPLCYPFLPASAGLREKLIALRIFSPTYWPDVIDRAPAESFEVALAKALTPIPIDQRYHPDYLTNFLKSTLDRNEVMI